MPVLLPRLTVDAIASFPEDGNRYELLDGMLLVTPGPGMPHQTIATLLAARLLDAVRACPGIRVWAPGVVAAPPNTWLEPDLLVGRYPESGRWEDLAERWLAVEVSGRGSRVYDRDYKRSAYLALGVAEVWLVDLSSRSILVSRPEGSLDMPFDAEMIWSPPGGPTVTLDVAAMFAAVPGGPID